MPPADSIAFSRASAFNARRRKLANSSPRWRTSDSSSRNDATSGRTVGTLGGSLSDTELRLQRSQQLTLRGINLFLGKSARRVTERQPPGHGTDPVWHAGAAVLADNPDRR